MGCFEEHEDPGKGHQRDHYQEEKWSFATHGTMNLWQNLIISWSDRAAAVGHQEVPV